MTFAEYALIAIAILHLLGLIKWAYGRRKRVEGSFKNPYAPYD